MQLLLRCAVTVATLLSPHVAQPQCMAIFQKQCSEAVHDQLSCTECLITRRKDFILAGCQLKEVEHFCVKFSASISTPVPTQAPTPLWQLLLPVFLSKPRTIPAAHSQRLRHMVDAANKKSKAPQGGSSQKSACYHFLDLQCGGSRAMGGLECASRLRRLHSWVM